MVKLVQHGKLGKSFSVAFDCPNIYAMLDVTVQII